MLKSLLTGLFFIYFLAGNAYAEDYNDIFWGMLKKENQEIVFVRCDSPSLKMKIVRTADANQENIEKAYQTFNQSKGSRCILRLSETSKIPGMAIMYLICMT